MSTTIDQLKRAIQLTEQIEKLQAELNHTVNGFLIGNGRSAEPLVATVKRGRKKGSKMSAAGRAAVAAAQKARWAKIKAAKGVSAPATSTAAPKAKAKRTARARIIEAQKKRWAKVKKAKA